MASPHTTGLIHLLSLYSSKTFDPENSAFVSPPVTHSVPQHALNTVFSFACVTPPAWMSVVLPPSASETVALFPSLHCTHVSSRRLFPVGHSRHPLHVATQVPQFVDLQQYYWIVSMRLLVFSSSNILISIVFALVLLLRVLWVNYTIALACNYCHFPDVT